MLQTPPPEPAPRPPAGLSNDDLEAPSDTLAALLLLRAHWTADSIRAGRVERRAFDGAGGDGGRPSSLSPTLTCPILLRSQVHALVGDWGDVDRHLDELR